MELEDCALAGVTYSTHGDVTVVDGSDVVIYLGGTDEVCWRACCFGGVV
jgi:hypothetical protein